MEWLGLSIFAWITIGVMIGKFGLSVTTNLPGDVVSLMSMGVLIVTGCVTTRRGLESFSDDWQRNYEPSSYKHGTISVRSGENIAFRMMPGGGFIARFSK